MKSLSAFVITVVSASALLFGLNGVEGVPVAMAETLPYMLKVDYAAPAFRENEVAISQDEIWGYEVWRIPCDVNFDLLTLPVLLPDDFITNVKSYWFGSNVSEQCLVFKTVDIDSRKSVYSEIFIARDFRAPLAATCKL